MDTNHSTNSQEQASSSSPVLSAASDITEVEAEAIDNEEEDFPVIPPDRRLSWLGWLVAIAIFILNKKIGLVFFILLLVFGKFPTLNLKHLPGTAGKLFRNVELIL